MALSFRSQTFQETKNELNRLADEGKLSKENFVDTVRGLGVDPDSFLDASKQYTEAKRAGETDFTGEGVIPGVPDFIERTAGRLIGESARGLYDFAGTVGRAITPDFIEDEVKSGLDSIGESLPEGLKEWTSEVFDPYHGDDLLGVGEDVVGTIGSYIVGGGLVTKAGKMAKGAPGLRALADRTASRLAQSGTKTKKAAKYAGYGLAGAGGTTIMEDPRENLFDMLMADEEGERLLAKASENNEYDDPELIDYLDAFVKNAAIEVPAGMLLALPAYLGKAWKNYRAFKPRTKVTRLGKLNSDWSSKLGTDQDTMNKIYLRKGEQKAAAIRANALAKELEGAAKKELGGWNDAVANKLNTAIQYSDEGLKNARARLRQVLAKEQTLIAKAQAAPDDASTKKALAKLYKFQSEDKALAQNLVNQLRRNKVDYDEIAQAGGQTKNIIDEMRTNIDTLSQYATDNVVQGKLIPTFDANKGIYLNRSYEVFDDPVFRKELNKRFDKFKNMKTYNPVTNQLENAGQIETDDVLEGVAKYLQDTGTKPDEIIDTMRQLIPQKGDDLGGVFEFLGSRGLDKVPGTSKVLAKRGEFADPVKLMWGEVKDPMKNYINTFEKLSVIKAENEFLEELAADMIRKGIANRGGSKGILDVDLTKVGAERFGRVLGRGKVENQQVKNPLQNLYVDPIYAKAVKDGLDEISKGENQALQLWMKAKGYTQNAKTVLSPATHGRNLIGNVFILAANGIAPGIKSSGKALEQTASMLAKKTNRELAETAAEYARLGVTNSGVNVNVMRRNLDAIRRNGGQDWMDKTAVTRGIKKANDLFQNLYQAEDDMFKIIHFEETKKTMAKAFPNKTAKEINELAAQRTRDLMPNYDAVPRSLKSLRGQVFGGDFLAFPAEMARVSKNLLAYTLDDLASGNKELMKTAAKRAAGTTAVALAPSMWSQTSRHTNNISDKQEKAINNAVPSYEAFQDRIYLSGINKDKLGKAGVNYLNVGPLDPFGYLKTVAKALHTAADEGITDPSYAKKAGIAAFENAIGTFVEPSMLLKAAVDLQDGKNYSNEPSVMGKLQNALGIAVGPFTPGIANFLKKRYAYEQSKAGSTKFVSPLIGEFGDGKNLPEGIGPGDFTISGSDQAFGGDVGIPAFFGLRNQRLDLTARLQSALNPSINKIRQSDKIFTDSLDNINATPREIYDAYDKSQRQRLAGYQELKSINESFEDLFGDDYVPEVIKGLNFRNPSKKIDDNTLKFLSDVRANRFRAGIPNYGRAQSYSGAPIPYDNIMNYYRSLNGTKILED